MGNPDDAADGLQDGMVAAYRRAASYRGEAQVTTWLHRVVVNACLDRLRAMKVRRAESLPDDLEEYGGRGSLVSATPETADPAEPERSSTSAGDAVLAALRELPDDQRAALVLVDMEGYPVAEAAVDARLRGRHDQVALLSRSRPPGAPAGRPDLPPEPAGQGVEGRGTLRPREPSHPRTRRADRRPRSAPTREPPDDRTATPTPPGPDRSAARRCE